MENNKKNFWKGALAGALAMFMVGAAALGIMNVAGVSLGTSQEKVVNATFIIPSAAAPTINMARAPASAPFQKFFLLFSIIYSFIPVMYYLTDSSVD